MLFGLFAALLVGLSKTGVPGVGIPAILLMAEAFAGSEKLSVGALLPILLVGDVLAVAFYREHTQWNRLWGLFPFVVAGMVPGALVLVWVDHQQFKIVLGFLILALLALEVGRRRLGWTELPGRWWFGAATGLVAGFGTTVGNAAGPVMSIYLIARGLRKEQFMGTWAWFFFIVNLSKVPIYVGLGMMTPATLRYDVAIVPAAVAGALLGKRLFVVVPQNVFNVLVLLLAAVAALRLVGVPIF
jgi:uncharacterized membrane protein YfcA